MKINGSIFKARVKTLCQQFLVLMLVCAISASTIFAQTKPDLTNWDNLNNFKTGASVVVRTKRGGVIQGSFGDFNPNEISVIITKAGFFTSKQILMKFDRSEVKEVRAKGSVEKYTAIGALIGAGGGIGVGAAADNAQESDEDRGVLTVLVAMAGAGVGALAGGVVHLIKKGRLVYQAP